MTTFALHVLEWLKSYDMLYISADAWWVLEEERVDKQRLQD